MNPRILIPAIVSICAAQQAVTPAGSWTGSIDIPGMGLGIEVMLKEGPTWSGRISIPAQGLRDYQLVEVKVNGSDVSFRMPGIPGDPSFRGRLGSGGLINGSFTQGGQSFPFRLRRGAPVAVVKPALPEGLVEREVQVGSQPWVLPGTLTLPAGKGPWPAVVLVHGSGPQDRDETIGPNTPFRDLAWGLAQRGVAVLRYEKRTKAYAKTIAQDLKNFTVWDETVLDAAEAAGLLQKQTDLDPKRIFVLGHSLGGYLLPRIARKAPFVAGLISMAGSTRPMEDLIVEQLTYQGAPAADIAEAKAQADRVKALEPGKDPEGPLPFGVPKAYWLDLKGYDPAREAKVLPQAMLILQGDRDIQVRTADFEGWSRALEGRPDVRLQRFANLSHLFIAGTGPGSQADYLRPGHVDEGALAAISGWVNQHR